MVLLESAGSGSVSSSQNKGFESHYNLNLAWPTGSPKEHNGPANRPEHSCV